VRTHTRLRRIHKSAKKIPGRSLSSTSGKLSHLSGLYGRPRHSTQTVDYLYYAVLPKQVEPTETTYSIYAHAQSDARKICYQMIDRGIPNPDELKLLDNKEEKDDKKDVADDFETLISFSHTTALQPVACEVYTTQYHNENHSIQSDSGLSGKIDARRIQEYLSGKHTDPVSDEHRRWQNYVWICTKHIQEQSNHLSLTQYAHNINAVQDNNHKCNDPLLGDIQVINDPIHLPGYHHLFYACKTINRQSYRALDALSTDYVYWVLSDHAQPSVAYETRDMEEPEYQDALCASQLDNSMCTPRDNIASTIGLFSNRHRDNHYTACPTQTAFI
jgi:hypothetical protein